MKSGSAESLRFDAAFDAQAAGRQHEGFAEGVGLQGHRPHRADQAERDVDDIAARRQHDIGRGAAFLADQLEGAGVVGPVGKHPPYEAAVDDGKILAVARGQRQHGLPGGRCDRWWVTGGVTAETGGWVKGDGRLGADAGPEGGARLMAPPGDASGMDDGGTGGGRSLKNWAKDGFGMPTPSGRQAQAPMPGVRSARPDRSHDLPEFHPLQSWRLLFTENAANSSLQADPSRSGHGFGQGRGYKPYKQRILARNCHSD